MSLSGVTRDGGLILHHSLRWDFALHCAIKFKCIWSFYPPMKNLKRKLMILRYRQSFTCWRRKTTMKPGDCKSFSCWGGKSKWSLEVLAYLKLISQLHAPPLSNQNTMTKTTTKNNYNFKMTLAKPICKTRSKRPGPCSALFFSPFMIHENERRDLTSVSHQFNNDIECQYP